MHELQAELSVFQKEFDLNGPSEWRIRVNLVTDSTITDTDVIIDMHSKFGQATARAPEAAGERAGRCHAWRRHGPRGRPAGRHRPYAVGRRRRAPDACEAEMSSGDGSVAFVSQVI